ncbi:hypothetical protein PCH70_35540 [Pseudomonas cichorii JBC1]|nr:hypothetical protein PCH70_35540 [Pseudomonas cichorii JBC1]
MAATDQARVVDSHEVRSDVMGYVDPQAVDQLAKLSANLRVPDRPRLVPLAVGHCVVRPGLEGFAGPILGAGHIRWDFTARLLRSELHHLPRRDRGASLGRNRFNDWFID